MPLRFDAPWSTFLRVITVGVFGILGGAVLAGAQVAVGVLASALAIAALLSVRGYVVELGTVRVLRLGWATTLDLRDLDAVERDPEAMRRAWRVFGMGGPFAFVGRFRSRAAGAFSAYATDPSRAVVLRWVDRTVVVTPDDPEAFVAAVETASERY